MIKGVFLSDIHLPLNINLRGILNYLSDFEPEVVILGGDIVDGLNLHGVESFRPESFKPSWYTRDCALLKTLVEEIESSCSPEKFIFLEGNHEERYTRLARKYPDLFRNSFNFLRDGVPDNLKKKFKWIPYGNYSSQVKIGDCIFTHGTIYPDAHAKKYATAYTPLKVVYGHLHDLQAYTMHTATPHLPARYALTAGCLCNRLPDWKKGEANKWINGFVSFISVNGVTTPSIHILEKGGRFNVGPKTYC
jgi:predicted phosphodiesterase